jgi:quercetin dioxygenase-like cupin family protein
MSHATDTTTDTTITKVDSRHSPHGALGQKYLASGVHVAMRLWDEEPTEGEKPESRREYETVGYVIAGRAELHLEGQMVLLEEGDSWVVPRGAAHRYRILERFKAVEATSPPAHAHARDEG